MYEFDSESLEDERRKLVSTKFNFALVVSGTLEEIQDVKRILIKLFPDLKFLYQKTSTGFLKIAEETPKPDFKKSHVRRGVEE